jgi:putative DNA primase/helicase
MDSQKRKIVRFWNGEWFRWSDGRYQVVSLAQFKSEINLAVKKHIDSRGIVTRDGNAVSVSNALVNNVLGAMQGMVLVDDSVEQPSWLTPNLTNNEYIALTNGIISLAPNGGNNLLAHTPEWFSTTCLPYSFDAKATCPRWLEFLDTVLEGDTERIRLLQESCGYLLTPDTRFHKFLLLQGAGANGKSVVLEIVEALLGSENVSHVGLEVLGDRFQGTMTINKLLNIAAEVNEHAKLDEGMLKKFIAGDTMYFDRKGIAGLSAKPTARLMVATNNPPMVLDRSEGMWRRMMLIPFRITIPPAQQDYQLASKLKSELPGIFNWAREGRRRLYGL